MMKTPEEIKKGIECCIKYLACVPTSECCDDCPYIGSCSSLEKDALAYIQQLEAKVPKWISVKERLPENEQIVIGYTPCDGFMFVGYYVKNCNWKQWYIITAMRSTKCMNKRVTHWMPLPEPPEV